MLTLLVSGAMVVAVTAGLAVAANGAASAAVPTGSLGSLTITPATGDTTVDPGGGINIAPTSRTSGPCPKDPNDTRADQQLIGPVGPDGVTAPSTATFPSSNPYFISHISAAGFSTLAPFNLVFNNTFRDAAKIRGTTMQPGEYHLTVDCLNSSGTQNFGTFTGGVIFDQNLNYTAIPPPSTGPSPSTSPSPSPSPSTSPSPTAAPTPTPGAGATATTTALTVIRIRLPFGLGGFVLPIATVTPHVAGTIQIKDGTANLGGPAPVAAGFAFGGFFVLPPGTHSLTAVFTPADPTVAQPSTSNVVTVRF